MTDREKVIEAIEKQKDKGIRLNDIWGDSGVFIETVGEIVDELVKEDKVEVRGSGGFDRYYML